MTTDQSFLQLCGRPDLWRRTGRPMQQRLRILNKLKNDITITLDTKEKILVEAGFSVKQEKVWKWPNEQ